jgi:hypothetical protein
VKADEIEAIAEKLRHLGIVFVVVGGSALEREYAVGTGDVDLLVAVGDFDSLEEAFRDRRDIAPFEPTGTIGSTKIIVASGWVEVEFIVGSPFSGDQRGDAFVRYVREYRSDPRGSVRWARPEIVWYMRLCTEDWRMYVTKIRRDVRAGVPESTFDRVLDVAEHFHIAKKIGSRVDEARGALRLFDSTERVR